MVATRSIGGRRFRRFKKNWQWLALCLPAIALYLVFHYLPIFGIILPFKQYRYVDGIFGSKWVGLKHFRVMLHMPDLWRLTRNTVGYSVLFMIVGLCLNLLTALFLYEINSKRLKKIYQTSIMFPNFLSWVIVGYITYALFNPTLGMLNQCRTALGMQRVDVYSNAAYWPLILTVVSSWKGLNGYLMFYANLMGIDPALFEAATIDGASKWQQRRYIALPSLTPLICLTVILSIGGLFSGDFGLFYSIPRNIGMLYETTDIINTYVFRGLQGGNFTTSAAVGLVQSVLGLILLVLTNAVIRKVSPENSMW